MKYWLMQTTCDVCHKQQQQSLKYDSVLIYQPTEMNYSPKLYSWTHRLATAPLNQHFTGVIVNDVIQQLHKSNQVDNFDNCDCLEQYALLGLSLSLASELTEIRASIKGQRRQTEMIENTYHCFSHCQLASSGLGGASDKAINNTLLLLLLKTARLCMHFCNGGKYMGYYMHVIMFQRSFVCQMHFLPIAT